MFHRHTLACHDHGQRFTRTHGWCRLTIYLIYGVHFFSLLGRDCFRKFSVSGSDLNTVWFNIVMCSSIIIPINSAFCVTCRKCWGIFITFYSQARFSWEGLIIRRSMAFHSLALWTARVSWLPPGTVCERKPLCDPYGLRWGASNYCLLSSSLLLFSTLFSE